MSANRNVANLSVAVVKTLVRMTPFAAVADTIGSAQECLNLLADIKNNALDNPNAEMIRSLNSAVKSEIKSIEDALKQDGMSRKLIKDAVAQLSEAARDTIKELAEDNNALIQAVQQPENFGAELKKHAARHSDGFSNIMQAHYTTLLDRITQEFLILAPWSPNFNRFALTSLLRCFPALSERIDRLEQQINEGFNSVREDAAAHHQDLKNDLASIHEDLRNKTTNSRPTKLEDEVWGSRPATLKHWIERDPTSNGTTLHDTIFSSPSSQRGSRCVLVGRAGSGKTSLAASIASRCESDTWSLVAWIDASTRSNIESGLIALGESVLYVQTNTQQDQRLRVEQVLATFRNTSKNKCLFVYDNVEGVDYLDGVLPDGPGVHVVVTTRRNSGWSNQEDWNIYALGNFTRDESVTHLLSVTKDTDQTTAGKVASYLGDLPLAIAQAAATCSNYYSNLQEYYADLQSTNIDELLEPIEGGYYNKGAIASLQLATKSVLSSIGDHKIQTEAETILAALCYLAESGVPTQWLKPDIHLTSRKAYKVLLDSSIIEQLNNGRTTSIHRLLAHAIRKRWDIGNYHEVANKVCSTISRQQDLISGEIGSKYSQTLTRNIIAQIYAMSYQKHSHFLFRSVPFLDCFYQTLTHLAHLQAHQRSLHSGEDIILANAIFLIADFSKSTSNAMTDDINEQYLRKEKVHKILQHFEGSIIWEVNVSGWLDTKIPSAYFMLARAYQLSGFLEVAIDHYELLLDVCAHNFSPYNTFEVDVRNSLEAARRELAQRDDSSPTDERKEER